MNDHKKFIKDTMGGYQREMFDMRAFHDTSLFHLPHTKRMLMVGKTYWDSVFCGHYKLLEEYIKRKPHGRVPTITEVINALVQLPGTRATMRELVQHPDGNNFGVLEMNIYPFIYAVDKGKHIQLTDALVEMLVHTDIGKDVPVRFLKPPYDICYLEMGALRTCPIGITHKHSGYHILEGAYVYNHNHLMLGSESRDMLEGLRIDPERPFRKLEIMLMGSPLGKENLLDDYGLTINLLIQDEEESIGDMIARHFHFYKNVAGSTGDLIIDSKLQSLKEREANAYEECIWLLAKGMLYTNSAGVLFREEKSYTEMVKNPKLTQQQKNGKNYRYQLNKVYDKIVVGHAQRLSAFSTGEGGSKSTHFRRGHIRLQRYGEGNLLIKPIMIDPTVVNAEKQKNGESIIVKEYKVTNDEQATKTR